MTLLIRNAKVFGRDDAEAGLRDVFISGKAISAIGTFPNKRADQVIDAQGGLLLPGFIDAHADADHSFDLFENPEQNGSLSHGTTTLICGQDGSSLAPLLYGTLEAVSKWAISKQINVNWRTTKEFLSMLSQKPLGVNVGTLVGHSTIRRSLIGDTLRDLTTRELDVLLLLISQSLEGGALGASISLNTAHTRGVPYHEVALVLREVKKYDGVGVITIRGEGEKLLSGLDEIIRLTEETGTRVLINMFAPREKEEDYYRKALDKLRNLPEALPLWFSLSAQDYTETPLYHFLPLALREGGWDAMNKSLKGKVAQEKTLAALPLLDPLRLTVLRTADNLAFQNKTLKDIMGDYAITNPREALMKLMKLTRLRAITRYRNIATALLPEAFSHPRVVAVGPFSSLVKLIERNGLSHSIFRKATETPATLFKLKGKGTLEEGADADLAILKKDEVMFTVIEGRIAWKQMEQDLRVTVGKVLRRNTNS